MIDINAEYVQLARLALSGRQQDALMVVRRASRKFQSNYPDLHAQLKGLLSKIESDTSGSIRGSNPSSFASTESSSSMVFNNPDNTAQTKPVWNERIGREFIEIVQERNRSAELAEAGISPTRSLLLTGAPGVGKTMSARWLAQELGRPLVTLDLAAVMSSYLGQTGSNLKKVLTDHSQDGSVLFLDEFDAIAKKRDDLSDVGELKRLVNVLLQALDDWPADGMLIAATNHPEILDRAIWRRFDKVIEMPHPERNEIKALIIPRLKSLKVKNHIELANTISIIFNNRSFADLDNWITSVIRGSIINEKSIMDAFSDKISNETNHLDSPEKLELACSLIHSGLSQRKAAEITGIARDTIRKKMVI